MPTPHPPIGTLSLSRSGDICSPHPRLYSIFQTGVVGISLSGYSQGTEPRRTHEQPAARRAARCYREREAHANVSPLHCVLSALNHGHADIRNRNTEQSPGDSVSPTRIALVERRAAHWFADSEKSRKNLWSARTFLAVPVRRDYGLKNPRGGDSRNTVSRDKPRLWRRLFRGLSPQRWFLGPEPARSRPVPTRTRSARTRTRQPHTNTNPHQSKVKHVLQLATAPRS